MLSAISTAGILPENVALVYPYVTLAMYFNPSWRASSILVRVWEETINSQGHNFERGHIPTLLPCAHFMACLTMTLVSNSSVSIRPSKPFRTSDLTNMIPFGATVDAS